MTKITETDIKKALAVGHSEDFFACEVAMESPIKELGQRYTQIIIGKQKRFRDQVIEKSAENARRKIQ